jgi:hypothetical protein
MEALHGGKPPKQNTPGTGRPDRSSAGRSDEADDLGASVRSVSDAAMSTASRAGEEAVRAAKTAQEGISCASRLAYRQGAEAGEYVGSLVKSDLLLTPSGAGALGFALGLLVARR